MTEFVRRHPRPSASALIPVFLVALGIVLWMTVGKVWIIVAGIGAFGPGVLREMGLLADLDEFQREAVARAGYHAYLAVGLVACATVTLLHGTGVEVQYPAELVTFMLVVAWLTWLFSFVMRVWGPKRTASAVLVAFGSFWLLFAVLTAFSEANGVGEVVLGLAMGATAVAPFFGCAWAAHRLPRTTGWLLLVFSVAAVGLFIRPWSWADSSQAWTTSLLTTTTLIVPLVAVGLGLVRSAPDDELVPDP